MGERACMRGVRVKRGWREDEGEEHGGSRNSSASGAGFCRCTLDMPLLPYSSAIVMTCASSNLSSCVALNVAKLPAVHNQFV
jgi:hypothetical protein